ncbi:MAG: hypothetical protein GX904_01615 [Acholeplasmataceae bacterium]|nr:hypothetical protein [Acholeplasmataceae bacterium]
MKKIVVIGATAVDLLGQCLGSLIANDSNPGRITVSVGGVGHNIALLLAGLGMDVDLISPLAQDDFGKLIANRLADARFRFLPIPVENAFSAVYLAACDKNGVLEVGINDFSLLDQIENTDFNRYDNLIRAADAIVLDANLPEMVIGYLINRYHPIPIYCDGVSQTKVLRFKPFLDKIASIKVNRQELASLHGLALPLGEASIRTICDKSSVFYVITDGKNPVVYNDNGNIKSQTPETPHRYLTSTGAGDALFAGVIFGIKSGMSADQAVGCGLKLARLTFENGLAELGKKSLERLLDEEGTFDG